MSAPKPNRQCHPSSGITFLDPRTGKLLMRQRRSKTIRALHRQGRLHLRVVEDIDTDDERL
jgi:hypothetical protein